MSDVSARPDATNDLISILIIMFLHSKLFRAITLVWEYGLVTCQSGFGYQQATTFNCRLILFSANVLLLVQLPYSHKLSRFTGERC